MKPSKSRRMDGLYLVLLGSAIFVLLGGALEYGAPHPVSDFRFVYNGVRCLLQNADPYQRSEFLRVLAKDGGNLGVGDLRSQYLEMSQYMYLPTSVIILPLALLGWGTALTLWSTLIAGSMILASFLVWSCGAEYAPVLSGALAFVILAGGQVLLLTGNPAGVVVGLSVIAVWCFVCQRFVYLGILCLAVGLMLKPHDAGMIWLYFLLAGRAHRKRALQTLGVTAALSALSVLWVTSVAPHWLAELHSNLTMLAARGHLNDPGPTSMAGHGIALIIDLQSVISVFWDEPGVYNFVSYFVCGGLILLWIITTLRRPPTLARTWLAVASVVPLSTLIVYHRLGDAKLLLLTIPACALIWSLGGWRGRFAVVLTGLGVLLTGELQWVGYLAILRHCANFPAWLQISAQVFPVPLILLSVSSFYLLIYMRWTEQSTVVAESSIQGDR